MLRNVDATERMATNHGITVSDLVAMSVVVNAIIEGTDHTSEFMLLPAAQAAGMPARRVRAQAIETNRPTEGMA